MASPLEIIRNLRPTYRFGDASSIDDEFLKREGIRGVVWDIDGTLMGYHHKDVDPALAHIRAMFRSGVGKHAILSNSDEIRYLELGEIFPEIPVLRGYRTASGDKLRVLNAGSDSMGLENVDHILSSGGRLIRKPDRYLVRAAAEEMGIEDVRDIMMVGDQYLTDIATANMAGARSAKVNNFRQSTFPARLRTTQRLERGLFRLRHPLG